jgi:hypothetical protein
MTEGGFPPGFPFFAACKPLCRAWTDGSTHAWEYLDRVRLIFGFSMTVAIKELKVLKRDNIIGALLVFADEHAENAKTVFVQPVLNGVTVIEQYFRVFQMAKQACTESCFKDARELWPTCEHGVDVRSNCSDCHFSDVRE